MLIKIEILQFDFFAFQNPDEQEENEQQQARADQESKNFEEMQEKGLFPYNQINKFPKPNNQKLHTFSKNNQKNIKKNEKIP